VKCFRLRFFIACVAFSHYLAATGCSGHKSALAFEKAGKDIASARLPY
jgi:hypothetical protein